MIPRLLRASLRRFWRAVLSLVYPHHMMSRDQANGGSLIYLRKRSEEPESLRSWLRYLLRDCVDHLLKRREPLLAL